MHEIKRHFLSYRKRRHDTQITWPYAFYVTLGSRCKMANSSSEDETDTLPERPTRIQPYQSEPVRQDFERVPVFWLGTRHSSVSEEPSCTLVRNTEKTGECFPILLTLVPNTFRQWQFIISHMRYLITKWQQLKCTKWLRFPVVFEESAILPANVRNLNEKADCEVYKKPNVRKFTPQDTGTLPRSIYDDLLEMQYLYLT